MGDEFARNIDDSWHESSFGQTPLPAINEYDLLRDVCTM